MRKWFLIAAAVALPLAVALAGGDTKSVQLREASVRTGPKHFKPLLATLKYGEKVEVVAGPDAGWYQVRLADGKTGYIHETAVTEQELAKIDASGQGTSGSGSAADNTAIAGKGFAKKSAGGATSDEVALAGKGFNPQVEKQYRVDHGELEEGFKKVEAMQRRKVSDEDLQRFLADGKLGDGKGQ